MSREQLAELIERDVEVHVRDRHGYRLRQRTFDLVIGISALAATSPVLMLAALAIWLEDRGPVLFKQQRVGRYGRLFTMYKLRTMRVDRGPDRGGRRADHARRQDLAQDLGRRITAVRQRGAR
jgi:lipopolysaccharide/colanic/teichoic acid biosynthesis glycosyltransferase